MYLMDQRMDIMDKGDCGVDRSRDSEVDKR